MYYSKQKTKQMIQDEIDLIKDRLRGLQELINKLDDFEDKQEGK